MATERGGNWKEGLRQNIVRRLEAGHRLRNRFDNGGVPHLQLILLARLAHAKEEKKTLKKIIIL
jgi:hypothetical protein